MNARENSHRVDVLFNYACVMILAALLCVIVAVVYVYSGEHWHALAAGLLSVWCFMQFYVCCVLWCYVWALQGESSNIVGAR